MQVSEGEQSLLSTHSIGTQSFLGSPIVFNGHLHVAS